MFAQIFEHRVKPNDLSSQVRQRVSMIAATHEVSPRISENTRHMSNQIGGCLYLTAGLERSE
jgi:hypothetical protein